VDDFFRRMATRLPVVAPGAHDVTVAHLGDGNLHYSVYPPDLDGALYERVVTEVEDAVLALGGSFSAEHGIGLSKRPSMARRKDKVAVEVMRALKTALDPAGIMNPGKVLPD
jgi:FAD/FMN-containing dehydrogenase